MMFYVLQSAVQVFAVWRMVCSGRTLYGGSKAGRRVYHSSLEMQSRRYRCPHGHYRHHGLRRAYRIRHSVGLSGRDIAQGSRTRGVPETGRAD
jgi:hypothetical protein